MMSGQGQRILFLDDDVGFLELAQRVLRKAGYSVIVHSEPAAALAAFAAAPEAFDLVVTDAAMPETSGVEVARRIAAIRADIPIIITADYFSPEDYIRAADCGVREVVSKCATVEELCLAFGRVITNAGEPRGSVD